MRGSLAITALAVLGLFVACYPSADCVSPCGVTFTGSDCAGYVRAESATIAAIGACDAGSPDDACSALAGWTVDVRPESETFPVGDAGQRGWAPSADEAAQLCVEAPKCDPADAGAIASIEAHGHVSGDTDRAHLTVTLADEAWSDGVAANELVHVAAGEYFGGDPYTAWSADGRACVVQVAKRGPFVLTGSEGGP